MIRSAVRALKSITFGPEAAMSRGTLPAFAVSSQRIRLSRPSMSIVPPDRYVCSLVVRSKKSAIGIGGSPRWNSAVSPRPVPSTNRPSAISFTVAAAVASAAG